MKNTFVNFLIDILTPVPSNPTMVVTSNGLGGMLVLLSIITSLTLVAIIVAVAILKKVDDGDVDTEE